MGKLLMISRKEAMKVQQYEYLSILIILERKNADGAGVRLWL
jgi:hypothetical protein